jgi:hypothetical protein
LVAKRRQLPPTLPVLPAANLHGLLRRRCFGKHRVDRSYHLLHALR